MENLTKKQKIIFIGMFLLMVITILYYFMGQGQKIEPELQENFDLVQEEKKEERKEIIVHITGCVVEEGIVKLKEGDRIANAIEKAGGITSDADMSKVNLAYKLKDGQKLYIPSNIEEDVPIITEKGDGIIGEATSESGKININTATQTELEILNGVGPSTALKIIQYRTQNGEFSSIEDIKNVPGIGEAKYESLKDSICVD